jgi:hypothetical protein
MAGVRSGCEERLVSKNTCRITFSARTCVTDERESYWYVTFPSIAARGDQATVAPGISLAIRRPPRVVSLQDEVALSIVCIEVLRDRDKQRQTPSW